MTPIPLYHIIYILIQVACVLKSNRISSVKTLHIKIMPAIKKYSDTGFPCCFKNRGLFRTLKVCQKAKKVTSVLLIVSRFS